MSAKNNYGVLVGQVVNNPAVSLMANRDFYTLIDLKVTNKETQQTEIIHCVSWDSNATYDVLFLKQGDLIQIEGYLHHYHYVDDKQHQQQLYQLVFYRFDILQQNTKDNDFYLECFLDNNHPIQFIKNKARRDIAIVQAEFNDQQHNATCTNFSQINLVITLPRAVQKLKQQQKCRNLSCIVKGEFHHQKLNVANIADYLVVNKSCEFKLHDNTNYVNIN